MELIASISRAKGKFFIIIIYQDAVVPGGIFETALFRNVISLIEQEGADLLQFFSMDPFSKVNKLVNILHVLATKTHFVFSSMTCFHPCGIKRLRSFLI